jgi:hypothetical protein
MATGISKESIVFETPRNYQASTIIPDDSLARGAQFTGLLRLFVTIVVAV